MVFEGEVIILGNARNMCRECNKPPHQRAPVRKDTCFPLLPFNLKKDICRTSKKRVTAFFFRFGKVYSKEKCRSRKKIAVAGKNKRKKLPQCAGETCCSRVVQGANLFIFFSCFTLFLL